MEGKIKEIKKLLADLVADQNKFIKTGHFREVVKLIDRIAGVRSAIRILEEPSNTQMHTDVCDHDWIIARNFQGDRCTKCDEYRRR